MCGMEVWSHVGGLEVWLNVPTRNVLQDLSRSCKTYPDKHSKIL